MSSRIDFFYYAFRNILLVSIPLLIFSIFVFTIPHSSAEISSGADNVQLVLSTSCTVNAVVTSEHTVSLNGGQLDNNVGNTKLSAYCNDNNGYSIYAVGSSGDVDGNTDLIYNNGFSDSYNIRTGVYDSNNVANPSSWTMKLTAGTGTGIDPVTGESVPTTPPIIVNGYDNYSAIPDVYTQVAKRTSGTNMITDSDASGSYLDTTYQIYANSYQPAGTYNGKVKYVIVHPNGNIPATPDLNTAFASAGKDKIYRDQSGSGPYYAMQDMDSIICNSVTGTGENTAAQLVDLRDNKLYHVAKLADGHCWMTSNLDLDIGGTNTVPLNSNNTDISTTASGSGIYTAGYTEQDGVWTWTPVSTAITSNYHISGTTVSPAWATNSYITPYSAEGGDTYYYTSNTTTGDTRYNSLQACKNASHAEDECRRYFVGNYYNWSAAIASNNSTDISTNNDKATNSICPRGWRLPNASQTDNVNNEFGRMLYQAGITAKVSAGNDSVGYTTGGFNKLRSSPYYFIRPGGIYGSTLYVPGVGGDYWSGTVSSNTSAYNFDFTNTDIYPAHNSNDLRSFGRSIRCIAR